MTATIAGTASAGKADRRVKFEVAEEEPVEDDAAGEDDSVLERFDWYRRLFDFSADIPPPASAGYGMEEDPDQNLIPQVQNV